MRTMPSIAPTAAPAVPTAEPTQVMPGRQPVCCHVIWHRSRADLSSHYISSSADRIMPTIRVLCAVVIFALYQGPYVHPTRVHGLFIKKITAVLLPGCSTGNPVRTRKAPCWAASGGSACVGADSRFATHQALPSPQHHLSPNLPVPRRLKLRQLRQLQEVHPVAWRTRASLDPASNRHPTTTQLDNIPQREWTRTLTMIYPPCTPGSSCACTLQPSHKWQRRAGSAVWPLRRDNGHLNFLTLFFI